MKTSQRRVGASCLRFPLNIAREEKVSQTKLRKSSALAWTETLMHVLSAEVTDACYRDATKVLHESKLASLTETVASINAWKRVAIATRFTSPIPQDCAQV